MASRRATDEAISRQHPIREEMPFQRLSWRIRGVSWGVLAVVLGAAGLFSAGPLSSASYVAGGGAVTAAGERFMRRDSSSELTIRLAAAPTPQFELVLGKAFVDAIDIEVAAPRPASSWRDDAGVHIDFNAPPAGGATAVTLVIRPRHWGAISAPVEVAGIGGFQFRAFIYP
jgi:hypothetical protein